MYVRLNLYSLLSGLACLCVEERWFAGVLIHKKNPNKNKCSMFHPVGAENMTCQIDSGTMPVLGS